jgi:hypothetical protein
MERPGIFGKIGEDLAALNVGKPFEVGKVATTSHFCVGPKSLAGIAEIDVGELGAQRA